MEEFDSLLSLVETLRSERGCPWDRSLRIDNFKTFLLEEVYELIEAIEKQDYDSIREELGDLLFHILFISQLAKEKGLFNIRDVLDETYKKMFDRHPHVFKNEKVENIEKNWEVLKKKEKKNYSLLGRLPKRLPALLKAYILSKRAEKLNFDWERKEEIYEKILEEIEELKEAEREGRKDRVKEEIGDLLFTVVQIARVERVDPEDALRSTIEKFIRRFNYIEKHMDIKENSAKLMNELWEKIKREEKEGE